MNDLFQQEDLLISYDRILSRADHYRSVLKAHFGELEQCRRVADLGCGSGILSIMLLQNGIRVDGLDISEVSLKILAKKASKHQCADLLHTQMADVSCKTELQASSYDGVNSMIMAHLLKNFRGHLQEAFRLLKIGGVFVITGRTDEQAPEVLIESTRRSLQRDGIYSMYETDFKLVANELLATSHERSNSLMSPEDTYERLKEAGFKHIHSLPNKTQGCMYTFRAYKEL